MRSVLLLLTHRAFGGVPDGTEITAAAAVEMVHAGSLAHDDLMDAATERRGVRTVNADYGTDMAVMVGDRLLARAGQAALSVSPQVASELIQSLVELIEGQVMEMTDAYDLGRTEERARRSISLKTGTLFRSGCVIGALTAGVGSGEEVGAGPALRRPVRQRLPDPRRPARPGLHQRAAGQAGRQRPAAGDLHRAAAARPAPAGAGLDQGRARLRGARDLSDGQVDKVLAALKQGPFMDETLAYVRSLAASAAAVLDEPAAAGRDWSVLRELPLDYISWAESLISR